MEHLVFPDNPNLSFLGFGEEAFAILDRLKEHPHIAQYREEKEAIERFLKTPFKQYRDDLAVHWVLPNRLALETERNVFSRLLKNDFGAGGCHYHYWMAFYRPGYRRLTDAQLSHSLWPEGLRVGLYIGSDGNKVLRSTRQSIEREPRRFLEIVNPLLETGRWWLRYHRGSSRSGNAVRHEEPLQALPDGLLRADGIGVRTLIPRKEVNELESRLVVQALQHVHTIWPLYRFLLSGSSGGAARRDDHPE